ncbi:MAG: hypothetical protein GY861_22090 [bacterium]|nr:hypothetical protein [bacterium]
MLVVCDDKKDVRILKDKSIDLVFATFNDEVYIVNAKRSNSYYSFHHILYMKDSIAAADTLEDCVIAALRNNDGVRVFAFKNFSNGYHRDDVEWVMKFTEGPLELFNTENEDNIEIVLRDPEVIDITCVRDSFVHIVAAEHLNNFYTLRCCSIGYIFRCIDGTNETVAKSSELFHTAIRNAIEAGVAVHAFKNRKEYIRWLWERIRATGQSGEKTQGE